MKCNINVFHSFEKVLLDIGEGSPLAACDVLLRLGGTVGSPCLSKRAAISAAVFRSFAVRSCAAAI